MLKKLKHGFTLVELVIVIAVIAVLAAVLIPTFITVIDNANNSADLQLVANMNTVMSTNLDENITATAENLRKYLSDNGLTDITTKKKDNVIVYNKAEKKFKRLNVTDTLKNKEVAYADGGTNFLEENPYSVEEIFAGNIVVSMGGNDFAEALYQLHNDPSSINTTNFMKAINSDAVAEKLSKVVNTTAYIDKNGQWQRFTITQINGKWSASKSVSSTRPESVADPTRIVFSEEIDTFDLGTLRDNNYKGIVLLPQTITKLTFDGYTIGEDLDSRVMFSGNVELLEEITEQHETFQPNVMDEKTLEEAKEAVAELGAQVTQNEFYVSANPADREWYYPTVSEAIAAADKSATYSGKPRSVIITDSDFISSESAINIPSLVTLNIPYYNDGEKYHIGEGFGVPSKSQEDPENGLFLAEKSIVDDDLRNNGVYTITGEYRKFKVTMNGNLTVENGGKLQIGGVVSYPGQFYNGHTSGYYGELTNNGTITVKEGGTIDTYGYIKGTGSVQADSGSVIYQPFIVTDFAGGMNTLSLYGLGQSPFLRYAMLNIQNTLTINYGALMYAHCNLYASSGYNRTDEVVIGFGEKTSNTKGLITLENSGSKVVCTYDKDKVILDAQNTGNNLMGDIGKTNISIYGNARTEALSLLGLVTTANVLFPVPFNFDFVLESNSHFNIYNHYVILPGASVTVKNQATLTVTEDATFYVMDYLTQSASMSGKTYPTTAQLENISSSGILTVNGTFEVNDRAEVGGVVRAGEAGAILKIGNAKVAGEFQIGGIGTYAANTSYYKFPLRVFDINSTDMEDYKNAGAHENDLKPANVPANSEYRAEASNNINIFEETNVSYYKSYDSKDTEDVIIAAGQKYVQKTATGTIAFTPTVGFAQTSGYETQANNFKTLSGYTYDVAKTTFEQAAEVIDAYYELSPKARQNVSPFSINTYNVETVSGLFEKDDLYKAAFSDSSSTVEKALGAVAAANKLEELSDKVSALLTEVKSKIETLREDSNYVILFSVEYKNTDAEKYQDISIDGVEEIPEENKVVDSDKTVIYFMASQAGEPQNLVGYSSDNKQYTFGTTDPAGTLFYAAYTAYVSNIEATEENVNTVKFTFYADMSLIRTTSYKTDNDAWNAYQPFSQVLNIKSNNNIEFDLNGNTLTYVVNANVGSNFITNAGTLNIHNGTIGVSHYRYRTDQGKNTDGTGYYLINSNDKLTLTDMVLMPYGVNVSDQTTASMSGIRTYYSAATSRGPEKIGDATLNNVTISAGAGGSNGSGFGSAESSSNSYNCIKGIVIDGGHAKLDGVNITGPGLGVVITTTTKTDEEQKGVSILNSDISASWHAIIIGNKAQGAYIRVKEITDCTLRSTNTFSSAALRIEDSGSMEKITVDKIVNCKMMSPTIALQISGQQLADGGNSVVIGTVESCNLIGDNIMSTNNSYYDTYGLNLKQYATVENFKDCLTVASSLSKERGTQPVAKAVSVGKGCVLNLIYDSANDYVAEGKGNYFSAFGPSTVSLFTGDGTITMNKATFDPSTNLSKDTVNYEGYDCYKLQQQAA